MNIPDNLYERVLYYLVEEVLMYQFASKGSIFSKTFREPLTEERKREKTSFFPPLTKRYLQYLISLSNTE